MKRLITHKFLGTTILLATAAIGITATATENNVNREQISVPHPVTIDETQIANQADQRVAKRISVLAERLSKVNEALDLIDRWNDPNIIGTGLQQLKLLADQSVPEAQIELAQLFLKGLPGHVSADPELAFNYFDLAARAGSVKADLQCSIMLMHGVGIKQDVNAGLLRLQKQSNSGNVAAQERLGQFLLDGIPNALSSNPEWAFKLFNEAAENGSTTAALQVAYMEIYGLGTPPTPKKGIRAANQLATNGSNGALLLLSEVYKSGVGDQINADLSRAHELALQALRAGSIPAVGFVTQMLLHHHSTEHDVTRALSVLQLAGEKGSAAAFFALGEIYEKGIAGHTAKDPASAYQYFSKATTLNHQQAKIKIASMLFEGKGTDSNPKIAVDMLTQMAASGDPEAKLMLSHLRAFNVDETAVRHSSTEKLTVANNSMISDALINLGDLHVTGRVSTDNGEIAYRYYADLLEDDDYFLSIVQPKLLVVLDESGSNPSNVEAAKRAYLKAADIGNPDGYLRLADLLQDSNGDTSVDKVAHEFLTKAVALGSQDAKLKLALTLIASNENPTNTETGFAKLEALAAVGHSTSQYELGRFLLPKSNSAVASDAKRAFTLFQLAAKDGHSAARLASLRMQIYGTGIPPNPSVGLSNLLKLIDKGSAEAMTLMGKIYAEGIPGHFPPNSSLSFYHYVRAANIGNTNATIQVAKMLVLGAGGPQDVALGVTLLKQLGDQGDLSGYTELAKLYEAGVPDAIPRDTAQAYTYFSKAAESGEPRATLKVALMQLETAGPVANQEVGLATLSELAAMGNATASLRLAEFYTGEVGLNSTPDLAQSFHFFTLAAKAGSDRAAIRMAEMLLTGNGTPQNIDRGLSLLEQFDEKGSAEAAYLLGKFYAGEGGLNSTPDMPLSFQYYAKAANAGSGSATIRMAEMLVLGEGTARDIDSGITLLKQAGQAGNASAYLILGDIFARGLSGKLDIPAAFSAYETAANNGSIDALVRLADIYKYGLLSTTNKTRSYNYLKTAAVSGNDYALYMLGRGLVDRDFGSMGTIKQGIDLLTEADHRNVPDASVRLAMLDKGWHPERFEATSKIGRLKELAAQGNVAAGLRIVEAYRDGFELRKNGITGQDLNKARTELLALSDQIEPIESEVQSLLIDLKVARKSEYPHIYKRVKSLPATKRPGALRQVLRVNPNAFIYLLQLQLSENGIYEGSANGLMTKKTIESIKAHCDSLNAQKFCRRGPLSPQVYTLLFYSF